MCRIPRTQVNLESRSFNELFNAWNPPPPPHTEPRGFTINHSYTVVNPNPKMGHQPPWLHPAKAWADDDPAIRYTRPRTTLRAVLQWSRTPHRLGDKGRIKREEEDGRGRRGPVDDGSRRKGPRRRKKKVRLD